MGKAIRILDLNLSGENIGQVTPGFSKLQYISSTGTQYIDTGVPAKSGLHFVLKMKFNNNASSVMGGDEGFAQSSFSFIVDSNKPTHPYLTYGNQYFILNFDAGDGSYIFDLNDNVWDFKSFSGTIVASHTFNKETFTGNSNIYLFGTSRDGSTNVLFSGRIYECQIYDGDLLIRDYVAAERVEDGKAGLFDNIDKVFYLNQGTGEFEKGPLAE